MTEPAIRLHPGESAVVGYGSLMSIKSLEQTLQRRYDGPFVPCHLNGWRRSWDVAMPNRTYYYVGDGTRIYPDHVLYLNVTAVSGSRINCVVFVLRPEELAAMHRREWIYNATVVTDQLAGVLVTGGNAIVYVAQARHVMRGATDPRKAAVRASYLQILDEGLRQRDAAFQAEYGATTDPVPSHLVIQDQLDTVRAP